MLIFYYVDYLGIMRGVYDLKKKIGALSVLLAISSIFIFPMNQINHYTYTLGFPFNFIWFRDFSSPPNNRLLILFSENYIKTEINLLAFIFCTLIIFLFLLIVYYFLVFIKTRFIKEA